MKFLDQEFAAQNIIISAYIKIFVNYSQFMTIINSLNLNWGDIVTGMFQIHKTVSGSLNQMISLECVLKSKNLTSLIKITFYLN